MGKVAATSVRVIDGDGRQVVIDAGQEIPSWAEEQVTNPAALAAGSEPDPSEEPVLGEGPMPEEIDPRAADYDSMTVAELREEIAKRNESRPAEGALDADGKKADLVATLKADDSQ